MILNFPKLMTDIDPKSSENTKEVKYQETNKTIPRLTNSNYRKSKIAGR